MITCGWPHKPPRWCVATILDLGFHHLILFNQKFLSPGSESGAGFTAQAHLAPLTQGHCAKDPVTWAFGIRVYEAVPRSSPSAIAPTVLHAKAFALWYSNWFLVKAAVTSGGVDKNAPNRGHFYRVCDQNIIYI